MNFLQERQTRLYIGLITGTGILMIVAMVCCNLVYQQLIVDWYSVSNQIENSMDIVGSMNWISVAFILICVFLVGLLLGGTLLYFKKRDKLYSEAAEVVERYAAGDFHSHLNGNQEGTLYRLFSDIDELAMSYKSREETEQKTKEFLKNTISDISHQLKTPLAALRMYTEIMKDESDHPETISRFTDQSEAALNRMERLIQLLLKVTRLDAGSITFAKEQYQVQEIVSEAIGDLRLRAQTEQKQIQIEGDHNYRISCDLLWTSEAISNLVKNALDHTQEHEMINITWNETPAMLHIAVTDHGSGIPQEEIHHIFKRFYRGSGAENRPGIGLGLPLAKAIIEGQDGSLTVQSSEGEGTTFTISFKKQQTVT